MAIRILVLGEIVGKPGIFAAKSAIPKLKEEYNLQGIIANADGATHGYGLGRNHSIYLRKMGIDVLTGGDQIYFKKDLHPQLEQAPYILRPANFPPGNPGRGWRVYSMGGVRVGVISLLGLSGFSRVHLSNPYSFLPEITKRLTDADITILDFHSCTTAEKAAMNILADGQVSAVVGSGIRTLTADAEILPKGTAVISDTGRTGSLMSVAGFKPEIEIQQFLTAIPERSQEWWLGLEAQGVVLEFDDNFKAAAITPIRFPVATPENEQQTDED
jgi:metallophosphoesterase (TIGR00282 family)